MSTLKEIAKATGVSARTVSRALNGTGYISDALKERIEAVARSMNYAPNRAAQSLRSRKSREIVVLSGSFDELAVRKIAGLEETVRSQGYTVHLICCREGMSQREEDELAAMIIRAAPVGVAALGVLGFLGRGERVFLRQLSDAGIRVLVMDGRAGEPTLGENVETLLIDRQAGVYEAVSYLARRGARRIAYAGFEGIHNWTRLEGYRRALAELGLEPIELEMDSTPPFESGAQVADWLETIRPDALQCFSDVLAMGVLHELHARGVSVPRDLAVVGFDDREFAAYASPPLTTIQQPNRELGVKAAERLLAWAALSDQALAGVSGIPTLIPARLVVRKTTL